MTTRACPVVRGDRTGTDVVTLERLALRVAGTLAGAGVRAGDRVFLPIDTTPDHLVLLLALVHLDVSVVVADASANASADTDRPLPVDRCRVRWQVRVDGGGELRDPVAVVRSGLLTSSVGDEAGDPAGDADTAGFDPSRWFDRADAMINWTRRATGQSVAELRSGRHALDLLDELHHRLTARPGDVLAPMVPPSRFTGTVLLLLAWSSGCDVLLVSGRASVPDTVRALADAAASIVVTTPALAREFALGVAAGPELRDDLRSLRAVRTVGRSGATLDAALQRACGVRPEPLESASAATVLEPAGWILHEEPTENASGAEPLDAGLRELLAAIRDDHGVFERIIDASSRRLESRRRSESAAQSLAAVLGEELALSGSWTAALSA